MVHHNKKGQVQYFLENAFRIGFLMVALVAFFLLINFYIVNKFDTNMLQAEVIANRIMYSDTFNYQKSSRTYTGLVDLDKFNDVTINSNINYANKKHVAVQMKLLDTKTSNLVQEAYLNKAQYEILYALKGVKGKGGATIYSKTYPITYTDSTFGDFNNYKYGTIQMTILVPNS